MIHAHAAATGQSDPHPAIFRNHQTIRGANFCFRKQLLLAQGTVRRYAITINMIARRVRVIQGFTIGREAQTVGQLYVIGDLAG